MELNNKTQTDYISRTNTNDIPIELVLKAKDEQIQALTAECEKAKKENKKYKTDLNQLKQKIIEEIPHLSPYKSNTNTSSDFLLTSEFSRIWYDFSNGDLINNFIEYEDEPILLYHLIQEMFLICYDLIKEIIKMKYMELNGVFKRQTNEESLKEIELRTKGLVKDNFNNIFNNDQEENSFFHSFMNKYNQFFNQLVPNPNEDQVEWFNCIKNSNEFSRMLCNVRKIILFIEFHEPKLSLNLVEFSSRKIILKEFIPNKNMLFRNNASSHYAIVFLNPPMARKFRYKNDILPIISSLSEEEYDNIRQNNDVLFEKDTKDKEKTKEDEDFELYKEYLHHQQGNDNESRQSFVHQQLNFDDPNDKISNHFYNDVSSSYENFNCYDSKGIRLSTKHNTDYNSHDQQKIISNLRDLTENINVHSTICNDSITIAKKHLQEKNNRREEALLNDSNDNSHSQSRKSIWIIGNSNDPSSIMSNTNTVSVDETKYNLKNTHIHASPQNSDQKKVPFSSRGGGMQCGPLIVNIEYNNYNNDYHPVNTEIKPQVSLKSNRLMKTRQSHPYAPTMTNDKRNSLNSITENKKSNIVSIVKNKTKIKKPLTINPNYSNPKYSHHEYNKDISIPPHKSSTIIQSYRNANTNPSMSTGRSNSKPQLKTPPNVLFNNYNANTRELSNKNKSNVSHPTVLSSTNKKTYVINNINDANHLISELKNNSDVLIKIKKAKGNQTPSNQSSYQQKTKEAVPGYNCAHTENNFTNMISTLRNVKQKKSTNIITRNVNQNQVSSNLNEGQILNSDNNFNLNGANCQDKIQKVVNYKKSQRSQNKKLISFIKLAKINSSMSNKNINQSIEAQKCIVNGNPHINNNNNINRLFPNEKMPCRNFKQ